MPGWGLLQFSGLVASLGGLGLIAWGVWSLRRNRPGGVGWIDAPSDRSSLDPWTGIPAPSRTLSRPDENLEAAAKILVETAGRASEWNAEAQGQAALLTYAVGGEPAPPEIAYLANVLATLARQAPGVLDREQAQLALREALGDGFGPVEVICPSSGAPFDRRDHRTFPTPNLPSEIAAVICLGFKTDQFRARAWVHTR